MHSGAVRETQRHHDDKTLRKVGERGQAKKSEAERAGGGGRRERKARIDQSGKEGGGRAELEARKTKWRHKRKTLHKVAERGQSKKSGTGRAVGSGRREGEVRIDQSLQRSRKCREMTTR